jgi:hypothetical protein
MFTNVHHTFVKVKFTFGILEECALFTLVFYCCLHIILYFYYLDNPF